MVECTMKDIFNVGYIMVIAGIIANVLKGIGPPMVRALDIGTEIAGILIVFYTSIKFYKDGRKRDKIMPPRALDHGEMSNMERFINN